MRIELPYDKEFHSRVILSKIHADFVNNYGQLMIEASKDIYERLMRHAINKLVKHYPDKENNTEVVCIDAFVLDRNELIELIENGYKQGIKDGSRYSIY